MTKKLSKLSTAENSVRMSLKEGGGGNPLKTWNFLLMNLKKN